MNQLKYGDTYACKRLRMLSYLTDLGYEPYATVPDPRNPKYNIWLFDNNDEFEAVVDDYFCRIKAKH